MPSHNSYLGSDRFIQNTYEQVLRDQGFTDDNNSGSVQDEEADFLKTMQRIKAKGDAGYYDMTTEQQQQYDQKNSSLGSGFGQKIIPPAPSAPSIFGMMGGKEEMSKAKEFLKNYEPPEDEDDSKQKVIPGREGDPTTFFKQFGLGGK